MSGQITVIDSVAEITTITTKAAANPLMSNIRRVNEAGAETAFLTSSPVIGYRMHYASGQIHASSIDISPNVAWNLLPTTGAILLSLVEQNQFAPGQHFRTWIQAEWYGRDVTGAFYVIDQENVSLTEAQLRWPLVTSWKQGQLVSDAQMNAASNADSAEWQV